MKMSKPIQTTIFLIILMSACTQPKKSVDENFVFNWDNATVYFVYIDRFYNGNPDNDVNYNRKNNYNSDLKNVATFHGGDIAGLTKKLQADYFKNLGITAIWITGVYEQIHGWVGGGSSNDFPHYAYHGYYPMDFTAMDKNFGTIEEFRKFIDLAHDQGIRIIMDAGINHPGYPTLLDAVQYNFGGVELTENQASEHLEGLRVNKDTDMEHFQEYAYLQHFDSVGCDSWKNWWGYEWIRTPDETNKDILTESIFGLPDFRTEVKTHVGLPPLMVNKWEMENEEFAPWINPSALKYRIELPISQSDYVINWLAAWVVEFGIDGFRCDVLDNVDMERWAQLRNECNKGLTQWRKNNPSKSASKWQDDFWMTGDIWGAGIEYYPKYAKSGFNSIVNFTFPKDGNLDSIGHVWQKYADELNSKPKWTTLSFLNNTYKRDTDFSNIKNCGTSLLLSPGAVQIFYGDEVARKTGAGKLSSDP
ncbi:MAG: alpha-amylase family glycosyl hydrolase, partial [Bacteroidales bacterium]|nr:alpha-amylase family glycosyl hydrolase [Bacteroidales bacterium]